MEKKYKNRYLNFLIFTFTLIFSFLTLSFKCYALDLGKLKASFIGGDYKAAISEGERILAGSSKDKGLDEAYYFLGLSYLKAGNFTKASDNFKVILSEFKGSKFSDEAWRLSQYVAKQSDLGVSEAITTQPQGVKKEEIYSVQVGAFSNKNNADNLMQELLRKGYPTYIEELKSQGQMSYRVRVGKLDTRQEISDLEKKLTKEGYPVKIYP